MAPLTSIRTSNGKLEIVNQLLLPHTTEFLEINTVEEAHDAIKSMKIRGAPAIASLASLSLSYHLTKALTASPSPDFLASPEALAAHVEQILAFLYTARPTAVNLGAATRRLQNNLSASLTAQSSARAIADTLIAEGKLIADEDVGRNKEMSKSGGDWLLKHVGSENTGSGLNVMTVCNTGSLATSGYGTALGLITYLHETGKLEKAYYTQTTPYHQGSRLTALELQTLKIPSVMLCDTMVGSLFQHHNIHAVAVGADRIARNGDTANKIGTYNAAVLAARHGIPFIVVAPISTVDLDVADGSGIPIEQRPAIEACLVRGALHTGAESSDEQAVVMITPRGLEGIYNPSFDVTPAELITAIVTEKGVAVRKDGEKTFDLSAIVPMSRDAVYIAVHGGAGMHSYSLEKEIKQALRLACKEALKISEQGTTLRHNELHDGAAPNPNRMALAMVGEAIAVLEDDTCLNAGYGSNLTLEGTVECDAAIMDGVSGDFGSVGAVSGVKNPIRLARAVLEHSKILDPLGRVPPLYETLVSEGAHAFAIANSADRAIETVIPDSLISPKARNDWVKWKTRLTSSQSMAAGSLTDIQDTVGAVAFQNAEAVAAAVSSGGILLKHPGRIGEAAIFGAGCWAEHFADARLSIACSISGEYIVRAMLARAIADAFRSAVASKNDTDPHDILEHVLLHSFWVPCQNRGIVDPDVGVLLLTAEEEELKTHGWYPIFSVDETNQIEVRLWCAFTTPSMAIAYASSVSTTPKVRHASKRNNVVHAPQTQVLRRPKNTDSSRTSEPRIFITAVPM
ncbi:hypothetical protein H0H81_003230 [Sphagnurus paluster]|uniref:Methylthioribose-1-phosphate isomerase n=1 Tax=Sphagnurus paluster TaxID=117069 RepID=A0A9P7KPE5_9AGAR|nr:hypothetical protein H0H81_003230 [Sphagnurus paluster]